MIVFFCTPSGCFGNALYANTALAYGVEQIPCFILIDTNGTIIGRWSHLTPDTTKEIDQIIN